MTEDKALKTSEKATEADPNEARGPARAVPVMMFDREYSIVSDRPGLAEIVAAAVDREARRLRVANSLFHRGVFDWPVQTAFRLALEHHCAQKALEGCRRELENCRRELETLTRRVEADAEKLAGLIEAGLDS